MHLRRCRCTLICIMLQGLLLNVIGQIVNSGRLVKSSRLVLTFHTVGDNNESHAVNVLNVVSAALGSSVDAASTVNDVDGGGDDSDKDDVDNNPSGVKVVKKYGRRLVLDLGVPFDLAIQRKFLEQRMGARAVQSVEVDHLVNAFSADMGLDGSFGGSDSDLNFVEDPLAPVNPLDPIVEGVAIDYASQKPLWNLMDDEPYSIHVEGIWNMTNSTPDVVVAVIDTGMAEAARPVFLNLLEGFDFISDPGISIDSDGRDPDATDPGDWGDMCPVPSWHGTKVASILAARHDNEWGMKGVAQNCSVLPIRVLGLCRMGYATDVTDAIVWAAGGNINGVPANPNPAEIISLSLAGAGACPDYLQSAVTQAIRLGSVVVAAAGNNNRNVSGYFPANCKGVVAVAASTRGGKLAAYSNWGDSIELSAPGGDSVDAIMTLGVDGSETGLEVSYGMGTSFSAPHVSGVLSLIGLDEGVSNHSSISSGIGSGLVSGFGSRIVSNLDRYMSFIKNSPRSANLTCNSQRCTGKIVDGYKLVVMAVSCGNLGSFYQCGNSWSYYSCYECGCPVSYYYSMENRFSHSGYDENGDWSEWYTIWEGCFWCPANHYCIGGNNGAAAWSVTSCSPGNYLSTTPYSYQDGFCSPCPVNHYCSGGTQWAVAWSVTGCGAGFYLSRSPSNTVDGQCSACGACGGNQFRSGCSGNSPGSCVDCGGCASGQYRSGCSGISAGGCVLCGGCGSNEYRDGCSWTSAGSCKSCTTLPACESFQYRSGCSGSSPGSCVPCQICGTGTGQYLSGCSGTSPGTCTSCNSLPVCKASEYRAFCSGMSSGSCVNCTSCGANEYRVGCSGTSPGNCTSCNSLPACGADQYRGNCLGTSPGTCISCRTLPACGLGKYRAGCAGTSMGICVQCAAGTYGTSVDALSAGNCTMCSAGTFSSAIGANSSATCQKCMPGTYATGPGTSAASNCTRCNPGKYSTFIGSTSNCVDCIAGTYTTVSGAVSADNCTACLAGAYSNSSGMSSSAGCVPCATGFFSTSLGATECSRCTTYNFCTESDTYIQACKAASDEICFSCLSWVPPRPANSFWIPASRDSLDQCVWRCIRSPFLHYQSDTGNCSACKLPSSCEVGQYATLCTEDRDGICKNCTRKPSGSYYLTPSHTYDADECTWACNAGLMRSNDRCINCTSGTYSTTGASACIRCTAGKYASEHGATACEDCEPGLYSSVGSSSCTVCGVGTYSSGIGASACVACDLNHYTPCMTSTCGATFCAICPRCNSVGYFRKNCSGASVGFCETCSNVRKN